MAGIDITISGVLYDKLARTSRPVAIIGEATYTGLSVGGGPIYPPEQPPGEVPHPEHPIVLPPDKPTDPPTEPPTNPPSADWSWVWNPRYGWHPAYVAGDKPQPPGKK